jgi:hypothetical protein
MVQFYFLKNSPKSYYNLEYNIEYIQRRYLKNMFTVFSVPTFVKVQIRVRLEFLITVK